MLSITANLITDPAGAAQCATIESRTAQPGPDNFERKGLHMEVLLLAVAATGIWAGSKCYTTGKRIGSRGGYAAGRRRMRRR